MDKILVIGAGGLGCEVIKSLVLQGYKDITIVDPDVVEIHNLSRQLLYRTEDCGKLKAEVAAARLNSMQHGIKAGYIAAPIQEVPIIAIAGFDIVISTVDNINARRWINMAFMIVRKLKQADNDGNRLVPLLVDGGSQELFGHVRVIRRLQDPCIECSLPLFSNEDDQPSCSFPRIPKTADDCVRYVMSAKWEYYARGGYSAKRRGPEPAVIDGVLEDAKAYGAAYGITSIAREKVAMILEKPVINIGSTNAIVAGVISNSITHTHRDYNFYFYSGAGNTVLEGFAMEKPEDCMMCRCNIITLKVSRYDLLRELVKLIATVVGDDQISVTSEKGTIYMGASEKLKQLYSHRLESTLEELQELLDQVVYVTIRGAAAWYCVYLEWRKQKLHPIGV